MLINYFIVTSSLIAYMMFTIGTSIFFTTSLFTGTGLDSVFFASPIGNKKFFKIFVF